MAAATVVAPSPTQPLAGPREHANQLPLADCRFYRWSLSANNGDTHATGLPGIVEVATAGTRSVVYPNSPAFPSASIRVNSISADGTVTFGTAGAPCTFDLLVWAK